MSRLVPGLLAIVLLGAGCSRSEPSGVVLVVIDTLRKDHLGLYGYTRPTSRGLERLAQRGWVFENHIARASQTVPSTLSLLLSRHPADHGHVHRELGQFMREKPYFEPELVFLSEVFERAGFATAGFVANPFSSSRTGFDQGFETFEHWPGDRPGEAAEIVDRAVQWLRSLPASRPFFLYLHPMDVHSPYRQPTPYPERFAPATDRPPLSVYGKVQRVAAADLEATVAHYDTGVLYVDEQLERLWRSLDELDRSDRTILAITSDHGEEFLEHGGTGRPPVTGRPVGPARGRNETRPVERRRGGATAGAGLCRMRRPNENERKSRMRSRGIARRRPRRRGGLAVSVIAASAAVGIGLAVSPGASSGQSRKASTEHYRKDYHFSADWFTHAIPVWKETRVSAGPARRREKDLDRLDEKLGLGLFPSPRK